MLVWKHIFLGGGRNTYLRNEESRGREVHQAMSGATSSCLFILNFRFWLNCLTISFTASVFRDECFPIVTATALEYLTYHNTSCFFRGGVPCEPDTLLKNESIHFWDGAQGKKPLILLERPGVAYIVCKHSTRLYGSMVALFELRLDRSYHLAKQSY